MTKKETTPSEATAPSVAINIQYVKDLSFENPGAPATLVAPKEAPQIEIALNLEAKAMKEDTHEVTLQITATAKSGDTSLFVAELSYAGLFTLKNVEAAQKEMILLIHCPTILFPFARRVLADATRDGGFQPLMIEPVDFASLYEQRKAQGAVEKKQ
ncbi:MAG: protein-export chaperone SecB [Rickettsiales bacterium]|jgi:preprotein translocase subunit SecB|nr:protein-export chaperone SecB [Rickettsiales bacterium]